MTSCIVDLIVIALDFTVKIIKREKERDENREVK